ncbi:calcium-independent phospholipase A2-gamma-like isoform X2 [Euwallacea fornicatus]|uniref:calcium-independent phospholipase A2-gamma-like isoform X2 n=1 Tax=Euwallacea fornicatus TaxID=995702 RepID=UPI00338E2E03
MSLNSWKFLNHLREIFQKFVLDKQELTQIINKIHQIQDLNDYISFTKTKISSVHHSVQKGCLSVLKSTTPIINREAQKIQINDKDLSSWKTVKRISQSQHLLVKPKELLESINAAKNEEDLLVNVEALILHLKEHPETRNNAIQHGAIRIILNKRLTITSEVVKGALREALAILGYSDPVSGRGIRILSIDGGGIRGVLVLEMLKKLEELTGKRVYEIFDFFCGVSTGAILTYSMGVHLRKLEDIIMRYEALSQEIFNQSRIFGTSKLVWSHAYYDTALWEKKLKEYLGNENLISTSRGPLCPKICVVSAIVNQSQLSAYTFRNYALPWRFQSEYEGTFNAQVWEAARASAAAPTFFEEFRINDLIHQDGGILVNNPTAIAIHEAKLLWPGVPIQCVVSFGTGRSVPSSVELAKLKALKKKVSLESGSEGTSWSNKFFKILDSATDTQAVHIMLSDLLPETVYYRFNPYLTEVIGMVETDLEKQKQMKRDTLMYLRRNEDKFQEAGKTLMLGKTLGQRIGEKIKFQRELLGI